MNDLEEERRRMLVAIFRAASAYCRNRSTDETADELVDERKAVSLVSSEREEGDRGIGISGRIAVLVHRSHRRQWFAFTLELLHAAHRDDRRGPVDYDRITNRFGRRETPAMRIRSQGWKFAAKRNDFRESRCAVGVGDIAALRGIHHIAAAPEVVKCIINGDRSGAVLVSELDRFIHRAIRD